MSQMGPGQDRNAHGRLADDPERAVRYSRLRELLFLVGMLWQWVTLLGWLGGRRSARWQTTTARLAPRPALITPLYALGFGLAQWLASLPLAYVSGYLVEHRFGLSNQNHRSWLVDNLKGLGVSLAL